jgi:hypothetical protein
MSLANPDSRRCTHISPDGVRCITRLCHLNPGPDCYVHAWRRPAMPPRADQEQAAHEEFERLMRQQEARISA